MKNFKEYLNEVEKNNQLAKSVTREKRPSKVNAKQVGFIHFDHGVDYDVLQADTHDLSYFGKGVVRIKGRTTGKESAAYVDWKNGTIRFYSGDQHDDKKFDKAVKFKAASLYESLEDLELMETLAEQILDESAPKLDRTMINTLNGIKEDLAKGKRSVKDIAKECATMEKQVHDDYSKSVLARLSDCKNRKEFENVLNSVL